MRKISGATMAAVVAAFAVCAAPAVAALTPKGPKQGPASYPTPVKPRPGAPAPVTAARSKPAGATATPAAGGKPK
jgi:hypothetical protein